jgi:carboxypeptidase PM20D1
MRSAVSLCCDRSSGDEILLIMKVAKRGLQGLGILFAGLVIMVLIRAVTWKAPSYERPVTLAAPIAIDADRAAARLSEAVRFQTVSNQDEAQNQWEQWDALQAWMVATYPAAHAATTRETVAGHTLIYTWAGSDPALKPIILMAHQDVVTIVPETLGDWRQPPFEGRIVDGVVWGRGAMDDKGSLVGILEAVEALAARGFKPKRTVYLVFGHDEEAGGTGAAAAAALLASRGVQPEFVLDEGGVGLTEDPVMGRPIAFIAIAEKAYATLKVEARAPGGHSSAPPGDTAVHVLARAIDRIASDPFPLLFNGPGADSIRALSADAPFLQRAIIANDWLFGPVIAAKAGASPDGAAMLHTTIAPTMLEGSPKENVLPERATALINYRIHPRDSREAVMERARRAVKGLPVTLSWMPGGSDRSPIAATDTQAWYQLAAVARAATGAPAIPGLTRGATDGRAMTRLTPNVYRFLPIMLTSEELATMHGVNERLSVANLKRSAEFYARLIATMAG